MLKLVPPRPIRNEETEYERFVRYYFGIVESRAPYLVRAAEGIAKNRPLTRVQRIMKAVRRVQARRKARALALQTAAVRRPKLTVVPNRTISYDPLEWPRCGPHSFDNGKPWPCHLYLVAN